MIKTAILKRLGIDTDELIAYTIFRQGHDARKRNAIELVYTLDIDVNNEQAVLVRLHDDPQVSVTPDTTYRFVTQAPKNLAQRPIVIGTGPCGLFVGLIWRKWAFVRSF